MIDTDKYEGHAEGPWKWSYSEDVVAQLLIIPNGNDGVGNGVCIGLGLADAQLIADAPLLLEEVKRLQLTADNLSSIIYDTEEVGQMLWEEKEELKTVLSEYEADPETTGRMLEDLRAEVKRLREEVGRLKRANDDAWRMLADDQGSEYND